MHIVFRADASPEIGTGHLMRCLTLADALQVRGAKTHFLCRQLPPHLRASIPSRGHLLTMLEGGRCEDADGDLRHSSWLGASQEKDVRDCAAALSGTHADWCIVDHYAIDRRWESEARTFSSQILAIDDLADRRHDCDILLDQNPDVSGGFRYRSLLPAGGRLLLGPRYALLRENFAQRRATISARNGKVRRILVFFGGIDIHNHVSSTIHALARAESVAVDVVIGAAHPAREQVVEECRSKGFTCHVETNRMAELMAEADLAIGAGGTAVLERCCMGLPTLAIPTAENQIRQLSDAAAALLVYSPEIHGPIGDGIACHLQALLENPSLLRAISRAGMRAVDGLGAARVADSLMASDIELRPAGPDDSTAILTWRNHPDVCAASMNQAPIQRRDHQAWFQRMLASNDRHLLIAIRAGAPVGVVRFDITGCSAEVSIYRVPGSPGRGLAEEILLRAERWLLASHPEVRELTARVRAENARSERLFQQAGYLPRSFEFIKVLQPHA